MGDAAGELADRIHLAGLDELVFERAALGHVHQSAREFHRPVGAILQQDRLVVEMLPAPVGALPAIFHRQQSAPLAQLDRGQHAVAVVGVEAVGPQSGVLRDMIEVVAGHRLEVAADEGGCARHGLQRLEVEDDRQRFDDRGLTLLGHAQFLLGAQQLGIGAKVGVQQVLLGPGLALDLPGHQEQVDEYRDL